MKSKNKTDKKKLYKNLRFKGFLPKQQILFILTHCHKNIATTLATRNEHEVFFIAGGHLVFADLIFLSFLIAT